ncbi:MAG: non-canonical purine NTP pyrophosphatase [Myxococcota bacterium]
MADALRAIVLATQNEKKRRELAELVAGRFVVRTLADDGLGDLEIIEDADTFAGNARRKADAVYKALAQRGRLHDVVAVLADDSGLMVDALDGRPGVRSARFAADHGLEAGDEANNVLLLQQLAGVSVDRRSARFCCAIYVRISDERSAEAFGTVEGHIATDLQGAGGFGYDPLFVPDEHPGRRMAELSSDEKHRISHRGKAMRLALEELESLLTHGSARS